MWNMPSIAAPASPAPGSGEDMPARSKIDQLPPEIRQEFQQALITKNFSDYEGFESWFEERGYQVSRSAAHRFGQDFQGKCEAIRIATEQAKAIVSVVGDDKGDMNEALIRLIQQLTFDILIKNEDADIASLLPKMGVMVAKLSKASVDQKKYAAEARKKALEEAADSIETTAKQEGVSSETIQKIRRDVLMMAS